VTKKTAASSNLSCTAKPKFREDNERGFSVVELVTVIMIMLVISAMAVIELQPMIEQVGGNAGLDEVKAALREARETAISQRRSIAIKFVGNNEIELFQMVVTGTGATATVVEATSPFDTIILNGRSQFLTFKGETDTPDGYVPGGLTVPDGIYAANVDGGPTGGMQFQSDGTFTNSTGNPINATFFIGVSGTNTAGRAATVLGNTGRVRGWYWTGGGWVL
jgi:type II secretory pathway pseudopilin PulG